MPTSTVHRSPLRRPAALLALVAVVGVLALTGCEKVGDRCTGVIADRGERMAYDAYGGLRADPVRWAALDDTARARIETFLAKDFVRFQEGSTSLAVVGDLHVFGRNAYQPVVCHDGVWQTATTVVPTTTTIDAPTTTEQDTSTTTIDAPTTTEPDTTTTVPSIDPTTTVPDVTTTTNAP